MCYCINPWCSNRENSDTAAYCNQCGTPLLVQDRYRLVRPLRQLDEWEPSEIFEIVDGEQTKVLKALKQESFHIQFEQEVKTLQHLKHPGIPSVEADGYFTLQLPQQRQLRCFVMEHIKGVNLSTWLQQHGSLDWETAADWLRQLAEVLNELHAEKLFHRDIKLSNIMLRPSGQMALIDFGTARIMTSTYFAKVASKYDITSIVSPGYTPLEQLNGRAIPQSDFYALGRSMVHLLTGEHPIDLPEDESTGRLNWLDKAAQPVPLWFVQLLNDMMAPFPGQRPLNAQALIERLEQKKAVRSPKQTSSETGRKTSRENSRFARWLIIANLIVLLMQLFLIPALTSLRSHYIQQNRTDSDLRAK